MTTILELASPRCSAEEFDGEIVALNLDTGTYFSMTGISGQIFNDLSNGHSVESILALTAEGEARAAVERFIGELQSAGLLRPKSGAPGPLAAAQVTAEGLAAAPAPLLETFGDMQSLLLLDPVHEVDEQAGWPKAPGT